MKKTALFSLFAALAVCFTASMAHATALWTFEISQPTTAGDGTTTFAAEQGPDATSSFAKGSHVGAAVYSTPAGNGSAHSFSATLWAVNDYWQFSTPTGGASSLPITWDQTSSGTGPGHFELEESNDGTTYSNVLAYTVLPNGTAPNAAWNATTAVPAYSFSSTLTGLTGATVFVRLVDLDTVSASGGTVGTGGTDRIDNVNIGGVIPAVPEPSTFVLCGLGLVGLVGAAQRRKSG